MRCVAPAAGTGTHDWPLTLRSIRYSLSGLKSEPQAERVVMSPVILPLLYGLLAIGQTTPPAPAAAPSGVAQPEAGTGPVPRAGTTEPTGDAFFEHDEEGRLRAVSVDEAVRSGAEFLRKLQAEQPVTAPVYISRLALEGDVVGDRAEFTVLVSIEVTRPGEWYDVPLALHEAHIRESKYDGPGEQAPRTGGPAEDGLHWSVRGQGTHRLELKVGVPLKPGPAGQQLTLRLPTLPDLFRPRCVLRVPGGPIVVTSRQGPPLPVRALENGSQEVTVDPTGQRLELTWRSRADETPMFSRVVTSFDLQQDGNQLRLAAVQQCDVEQGAVSQIEVRLPTDGEFRLQSVGRRVAAATTATVALRHSEIAGRPGWIQVELGEPASGQFVLDWLFVRPFPESGGRIEVDGLVLSAARNQRGRVEIQPIKGYDVEYVATASSGAQETNPVNPTAPALKAFEFFKQPFELVFVTSRVQPKLTATPRYFLRLDADRAELYLELQAAVLAGVVDALQIDWPAAGRDGWTCGSTSVDVQTESGLERTSLKVPAAVITSGNGVPSGSFRIQLSQPIAGRSTDATRLRLVVPFSRLIPPDETGFDLTLPRLQGAATQPGALFIAGGRQLEPALTPSLEALKRSSTSAAPPAGLPAEFAGPAVLGVSLAASPEALQVGWMEHARTIAAETMVSVAELRRGAVNVVQRVSYSVAYGDVSSLLLELPPAFDQLFPPGIERLSGREGNIGVLFRLADGTPLEAERVGTNLRVPLPAPRSGRFDLLIDYVLPTPATGGEESVSFELPVVRALDADFGSVVVSFKEAERVRLDDSEQGWTSLAPRNGGVAWQSSGRRSVVRLTIDESLLNVPQQYTITAAYLQTRFGEQGEATTLGEYAIQGAPQRLLIMLPHAEGPVEFRWNGELLELNRQALPVEGALDQYTLDLPLGDGAPQSGRLAVKYQSPSRGVLGLLARRSIEFPRFPSKVWVGETWFEVVLPPGRQLFEPPPGMAPQYVWQRQAAVWMRQPTPEYQRRRAELVSRSTDAESQFSRGNSYAYGAVGAVTRTSLGAMSQSFIVLIGAGLTLFLGFVWGRVPATRSVFSLLVLGFLFALASVWRLELMQLLLQPALLGLLLAAVATVFDSAARRRLALSRGDTTFDRLAPVEHDSRPSGRSSVSPTPARTAVYRSAGVSDSGGTP